MATQAPTAAPSAEKPTTTSGGPAPATNGGKGRGRKGNTGDVMAGEGQEPGVAAAKAAAQGATDADAPKVRKDVVPPQYRARYQETGGNNGDFIAEELSAVTKDGGTSTLSAIKKENDIPEAKWSGLNNGMVRMNLANTLRARYLRGEPITIAGKRFDMRQQLEEFGNCKPDNETQVNKFLKFIGVNQTDRMRKAIVGFLTPKPDKAAERAKREEERAAAKAAKAKEREDAKAAKAKEREEAAAKRAAEKKAASAAKSADAGKAKADAK